MIKVGDLVLVTNPRRDAAGKIDPSTAKAYHEWIGKVFEVTRVSKVGRRKGIYLAECSMFFLDEVKQLSESEILLRRFRGYDSKL